MPKRRLTELAKEYNVPFEELLDTVYHKMEESMVTGKGRNLWINEEGQSILDDIVPMPILYRGRVIFQPPNPNFVTVFINEISKKVHVKVPLRMKGRLLDKVIYIEGDNSGLETKYKWVKAPDRV